MAMTTVRGSVTRVFYNGTGAEVTEQFTVRGTERTKKWTAWFESAHGLTEGQQVEVSGLHSDEISEWEKDGETRQNIKRSLNKARIVGAAAPAETGGAWEQEPWATTSSAETPF